MPDLRSPILVAMLSPRAHAVAQRRAAEQVPGVREAVLTGRAPHAAPAAARALPRPAGRKSRSGGFRRDGGPEIVGRVRDGEVSSFGGRKREGLGPPETFEPKIVGGQSPFSFPSRGSGRPGAWGSADPPIKFGASVINCI